LPEMGFLDPGLRIRGDVSGSYQRKDQRRGGEIYIMPKENQ
jgi:hypothetical protein